MRVINAIDPETARDIRAAISGKPRLKPAKAKKSEPVKCYVSQFHKFDPRTNAHTVQLPIAFNRANYNASRTPWYLKEKAVKEMREQVWLAMNAYFPGMRTDSAERERVLRMEFVRLAVNKMDVKDNLPAAFKAILDAVCSFLVWGQDAPLHVRAIGYADDRLEQRGVSWSYRQQQCASNPRLYGIQVILHCAARASGETE